MTILKIKCCLSRKVIILKGFHCLCGVGDCVVCLGNCKKNSLSFFLFFLSLLLDVYFVLSKVNNNSSRIFINCKPQI